MAKGARVATLDSLRRQFQEGDLKDLNLVIKADVGGTAEVLADTLTQLSTDKIRVRILRAGVGAISEDDVLLASASEALIIGFNVKTERSADTTAERQKVDIRLHSIIYELIDESPSRYARACSILSTKKPFKAMPKFARSSRSAKSALSPAAMWPMARFAAIVKSASNRDGDVIHTGKIEALKRFKNDASEVKNGLECGISIVNFNNIQSGDIIEAFAMERIAPQLAPPTVAATK